MPTADKISHLTEAFELFTQKTALLEKAYQSLRDQFQQVNIQLADTNKQLQDILGNMSQGLLFVSKEGIVTTYNPAAEKILERPQCALLGRPFADHLTLPLEGSHRFTYGAKQLEISSTSIEGSHPGTLLLIRDVTEILQLQRILQRQDRLKELGEMAASVAHEIRNPLGGIEGWASLLKRDLAHLPKEQSMAERIIQGVKALNRLVGNILHYSRPVDVNLEPTDLPSLLTDICSTFQLDPQCRPSIELRQQYLVNCPPVATDRMILKSIILNLLLNAYQATPDKGTVTLALSRPQEGQIEVSVSDTGCGIPPENLEKIFSPFFTTKQEGNGFGLSEVHRCVQVLGGHIDVRSTVNVGSCFAITLQG